MAIVSCSGGNNDILNQGPMTPNVAGSWEFMAISTDHPGLVTGVEVALKEGQIFTNGAYQPDGNISATGNSQIVFITIDPTTNNISSFGGSCAAVDSTQNLAGTLTGIGAPVSNFVLTQNGNVFNLTAILSADGKSLQGTYQSVDGSGCTDTGTFNGLVVPKLSGTYTGALCRPLDTECVYPDSASDSATATLTQSGSNATLTLTLTGDDNTALTLTGPVTGNAFAVTGTMQGQTVTYNGYFEATYDCLTQNYDIASIFLANPAAISESNPSGQVGLLTVPQTQQCQ